MPAKATSQKRLAVIAPLKHNNHIVVSPTQSSEAKVSRGAQKEGELALYSGLLLSEYSGLVGIRGLGAREGILDGGLDGYGDPYGASWYFGVSSVSEKYPCSDSVFSCPIPSEFISARGLPNGEGCLRVNCPRIGASGETGAPGNGVDFPDPVPVNKMETGSFPAG